MKATVMFVLGFVLGASGYKRYIVKESVRYLNDPQNREQLVQKVDEILKERSSGAIKHPHQYNDYPIGPKRDWTYFKRAETTTDCRLANEDDYHPYFD